MGLAPVINADVSVVIPCYNSAATIERALDSIARQSLPPKEVFVVDNASSDSTCDMTLEFAQRNPRLKVSLTRLKTNVGPGSARNIGWDQSQASLIAFLDADDSWHPSKLELQHAVINNHPNHQLFGHAYQVVSPSAQIPLEITGTGRVRYFTLRHFLIRNRVSTPTVIIRRQLPYRFPSELWFAEDLALWTQTLSTGGTAVVLDLALTQLYKSAYGASGLSAQLQEMHSGELMVIDQLRNDGAISGVEHALSKYWMRSKYLRRVVRGRLSD